MKFWAQKGPVTPQEGKCRLCENSELKRSQRSHKNDFRRERLKLFINKSDSHVFDSVNKINNISEKYCQEIVYRIQ